MEAPQKFRTALNGFHRGDVVQYLEFLNAKHQTQVNQLRLEADTLRTQLEELSSAEPTPDPQLLAQCEDLKAQLEASQAAVGEYQAQTEASEAKLALCQADLETAKAQLEAAEAERQQLQERCDALEKTCGELKGRWEASQTSEPLDTYRQAENMVRQSRTRAELVYYQTNGVLTEASAKVDAAAKEITALADQVQTELTRLQMAVSGSKQALQDAAAMMKSIRPNE